MGIQDTREIHATDGENKNRLELDKMRPHSAQDWKLLTKDDKQKLAKELEKKNKTLEDYEAEIKTLWPPEKTLPKAQWRKR